MRAANRLRSVFGLDVTLMAFRSGQKGPRFQGWQRSRPEMFTDLDAEDIDEGRKNCGVLLTDGLGCIDLDADSAMDRFFECNGNLRTAFAVRGTKGCKLFVRWSDGYPQGGQKIKDENGNEVAEILGERKNATVAGTHPAGTLYHEVGGDEVPEIAFDDIRWPEEWNMGSIVSAGEAQAEEELIRLKMRYGDPWKIESKKTKDGDEIEVVVGLNERFWAAVIRRETDLIHCPDTQAFWNYEDETGLFVPQSAEGLREIAGMRLFEAAKDENRPEVKNLATVNHLDKIVKAARGVCEERSFFDEGPKSIHCANGHIRDDMTFDSVFSPSYRSRNRSPHPFQDDADCPRFREELLCRVLPRGDDQLLMQKIFGLALLGDNPAQKIALLHGPGGAGKGVLLRILRAVVGPENVCELRTKHLAERFEINRFVGKSLLLGSDVPGDFLECRGAEVLKSLVGGDPLSAEGKGQNTYVTVEGNFNVFVVSNTRLRCRLDGDVSAWRRRLILFETKAQPPPKRIPNFEQVLIREEGAGILRWAVEGFVAALDDLNQYGDLVLTAEQSGRVDDLLMESAALERFVKVGITKGDNTLTVDEIERRFADFCSDRGWSVPPVSRIHRELPDLMLRFHRKEKRNDIKRDGKSRRGWSGVGFAEEEEP